MSDEEKKCIDPELEKFLKENKEMLKRIFGEEKEILEKFLNEEKEYFKGMFEEEQSRAEEFFSEKKHKAKETAEDVFKALSDPDVQKHFMKMGIEFMMAMSALMKVMPFPDFMKDMANKAKGPGFGFGFDSDSGGSGWEKVDIEMSFKDDECKDE
ncbi:MAG: hypothetical protein FWC44_01625 [Methanomassiliicoccaceae archaeon]|nr:hypothetical protein [Methanomassiliicoccaceae archaeon]